jgi:hypothetical protein
MYVVLAYLNAAAGQDACPTVSRPRISRLIAYFARCLSSINPFLQKRTQTFLDFIGDREKNEPKRTQKSAGFVPTLDYLSAEALAKADGLEAADLRFLRELTRFNAFLHLALRRERTRKDV